MPRLIINADDLGITPQRSHGIFGAFEHGIVTSTTVMATMPGGEIAARHAKEKDLPTGLHLCLTTGSPVSPEGSVDSLLDHGGLFYPRERFLRLLSEGEIDLGHVQRELRAQIEWSFDHRGTITHVDGHHHLHVHPLIAPIVAVLLPEYGIRFARIPFEPLPPFGFAISEEQTTFIEGIHAWSGAARTLFEAHGVTGTDHFRGMALSGNASAKNLRHTLTRLPEGTTELMVHPGSANPMGEPFEIHPQRQTELNMLTDPGLPALLAERKIELCSYGDL